MKIRVLVVDDEEDTLNLLRMILDISGYEPIITLNSVEAIEIAERTKPHVVLLDIMMPKLDGFTLCKMMRANQATKNLPIMFVTAYPALDIEERRGDAGADLVIFKPIDMDSLIDQIEKAIKQRAITAAAVPAAPVAPVAPSVIPAPVIQPPSPSQPTAAKQEPAKGPVASPPVEPDKK
ncbi:MAG TPA: response regulator [Aggregatilineaceae bacterium]|nr:response regulator [Aggregatilineaceae bacterium]